MAQREAVGNLSRRLQVVELLRILGWYCEIVCSLGRDTSSPVEATSILDEIVSSFLFYYFLQEVSRRLPRWLCGCVVKGYGSVEARWPVTIMHLGNVCLFDFLYPVSIVTL